MTHKCYIVYLHFSLRQVQGQTAGSLIAPFQVAKEPERDEQQSDEAHADVQHAQWFVEFFAILHGVLQRKHL